MYNMTYPSFLRFIDQRGVCSQHVRHRPIPLQRFGHRLPDCMQFNGCCSQLAACVSWVCASKSCVSQNRTGRFLSSVNAPKQRRKSTYSERQDPLLSTASAAPPQKKTPNKHPSFLSYCEPTTCTSTHFVLMFCILY